MADSFFGFDTSLSNLNDDEGGGEPSEDEYDALNDETFGHESDMFDWETEHEQLACVLENSRPALVPRFAQSDPAAKLEASLSQLVLDEAEIPQRALSSSVWRHDQPMAPTPVPMLKNVCTVEELERQLRQKQQPGFPQQNMFQPRYPPVILQRPPGLQAPVPLPFAPQQNMHNMTQMTQPLNKIIGQSTQMPQNNLMGSMNQMGQNMNQLGQNHNQIGQNVNQFMQNVNQMNNFQNNQIGNSMMGLNQGMHQMNQMGGQGLNQMSQNMNQMSQTMNQMSHSMNQMGPNLNHIGPNVNHIGPNVNHIGPNVNHIGPNQLGQNMSQNMNQLGQNMNQMGQNMNQMGQNVNQMGQNVNQMMPNGNQFNPGMNQFPHMMGQPRMMGPPPGINMQRPGQNFNQNMGPFNQTFRGPTSMQGKPNDQPTINHMQLKNQPMNHKPSVNQIQAPQINNHQKILPNQINQNQNPTQKLQKSRVYNNSKNPPLNSPNMTSHNLTSQNLVQFIQNTHPMLHNFHNANHHPMLNNRNNMFNNNQMVNNHVFNQRLNGSFNNNRHSINGDDISIGSDSDEYAGLMTPREKQWLINIQMLQLSSGTPYIHDFYYTVFLERQASKEKEGMKEAHKANQQNHPFYSGSVEGTTNTNNSGGRERHNSARLNQDEPYAPAQFENSLGKLQCGSVTAPRKIIDVEVVGSSPDTGRASRAASVASTANPAEMPREMRKTKQLLLDIESLYVILLRLEELNDPLAISNALILKEREEKQKQLEQAQRDAENDVEEDSNLFLRNIESVQRRPKQDSPKSDTVDKRQVVNLAVSQKPPVKNLLDEDKEDLINKMFAGLLHNDRVQQMLAVRKGRTLVSRFASRCVSNHALSRALWSRVLLALPTASRREPAGLAPLAVHYCRYIQNCSGWSSVLESCCLLSEALDPARTPYALTSPLTLSCVCALIDKASLLVNTPDATSNERQWYKFLKTLARALKNTTLTVARPIQPYNANKLAIHIKQLESRSTIEILQRGKTAEFADISKGDVSEQLIKHLC